MATLARKVLLKQDLHVVSEMFVNCRIVTTDSIIIWRGYLSNVPLRIYLALQFTYTTQSHSFDDQILVNSIFGSFATETAVLDTTKW